MLAILLALVVVVVIVAAAMTPLPHWQDDGDCTRIAQHTIRIPSNIERLTLWYARYYLHVENRP